MGLRKRAVGWVKDDPFGVEFAEIDLATNDLSARGVAIAGGPISYRLDYTLQTAADFVTSRLHVVSHGEGWRRAIELLRDGHGIWTLRTQEEGSVDLPAPGGDPVGLTDALDCDLALSPVTNLMPVLRHDLLSGGDAFQLTAAWVSVPDLSVHADGQRYDFVRADHDQRVIRFEAVDGTFTADIRVDRDGIVVDYPGMLTDSNRPPETRPADAIDKTCIACHQCQSPLKVAHPVCADPRTDCDQTPTDDPCRGDSLARADDAVAAVGRRSDLSTLEEPRSRRLVRRRPVAA